MADGSRTWVSATGQHPHDHGAWATSGAQQRVLRTVGHDGSVQPEDGDCATMASALRRALATVTIGGVTAPVTELERHDDHRDRAYRAVSLELPDPAAGAIRRLASTCGAAGHHDRRNGKQSIDTVTVTIGGKAPTHVAASALDPGRD